MKRRTRQFALDAIQFSCKLPRGMEYEIIKRQLIRAAGSVGANYRAACRARSRRDFVFRIGVVAEESDEVQYWLKIVEELRGKDDARLNSLKQEAHEIVAIMVASINTARRKLKR